MSKTKLKQPIFSIEKINNNLLNKKRNITLNNNQLTSTNSFIQEKKFEKKLSSNDTNNVNDAKIIPVICRRAILNHFSKKENGRKMKIYY